MEQNYRNSLDRYLEISGTTRIFVMPKLKFMFATNNNLTLLWSGFAKAPGVTLNVGLLKQGSFFA